jgi:hypothetical protein
MIFLTVSFLILGLIGGCALIVDDIKNKADDESLPQWIRVGGGRLQWTYILAAAGPLISALANMLDYGVWVLLSIAELYVGMLIAKKLMPKELQVTLFSISPIPLIVITGSFLNYWYIG